MPSSYARRAVEIFKREGAVKLVVATVHFVTARVFSKLPPRYQLYLFRLRTRLNDVSNRIQYAAPADPFQTILIEPTEIGKRINGFSKPTRGLGQTRNGDWDSQKYQKDITHPKITVFSDVFVDGKAWEDTEYYTIMKDTYEKTHINEKYDNFDEFFRDCTNKYGRIFTEIDEKGYKKDHKSISIWRNYDSMTVRDALEVLVVIDRNGEILHAGGKHRFGIARALAIPIPVQVVCRHEDWQQRRDDIYTNGLSAADEELRDHPDLQDVLDRAARSRK